MLIVTGDRDALQLVDERIHVLATKRGITDTVEYDRQGVIERYGITPEQLPDLKALMGDASDNIPGVPGIGEKTGGKLIAEYGTLEHLLAHAEEVKGKTGTALTAYAEQARQSKQLATIHTEVPLEEFSWECCQRQPWDQQAAAELFRRLDFRSLLGRLATEETTDAATDTQATTAEEPLHDTRVVDSPDELRRLVKTIQEIGQCAVLPVSEAGDPLRDRLVGLALSAGQDVHVYVPLHGAPPAQASLFGEDEVAGEDDARGMNGCGRWRPCWKMPA